MMETKMSINDEIKQAEIQFGKNVRKVRQLMGESQENLGATIRLTGAMISMVERGTRSMSFPTAYKICKALDTDMSEMLKDWE